MMAEAPSPPMPLSEILRVRSVGRLRSDAASSKHTCIYIGYHCLPNCLIYKLSLTYIRNH